MLATKMLGSDASDTTAPTAPTGLTATPASTSQINLAWTDASDDEAGFRVYRSTNGVDYAQVGTDLAAGTQAHNDTPIDDGTTYYYKIGVFDAAGNEALSDAVSTNTLLLSLTAYWKLDEESAGSAPVTRNDSVGTSHLTDNGTTASRSGKVSNGGDFVPADNTRLSVNDNAALSMGDIDFSIACWVYPDAIGGAVVVLHKGTSGSAGEYEYLLLVSAAGAGGRWRWAVSNSTTATTLNADAYGAPSVGAWQFLVAWHDATANKIYIQVNNGTVNEAACTHGSWDSDKVFAIGALSDGTLDFDGIVDEVGIWKRVLTADERASLYNGGTGTTHPF